MLEKYDVVYQEKFVLPKQMKQMALMYKLKETRKEEFFVFSVLLQMVMCPTIRF